MFTQKRSDIISYYCEKNGSHKLMIKLLTIFLAICHLLLGVILPVRVTVSNLSNNTTDFPLCSHCLYMGCLSFVCKHGYLFVSKLIVTDL